MLQLLISIQDGGLVIQPILKTTSLGMPLGCDSAHPRHALASSAAACVRQFGPLSSCASLAEETKLKFIERFSLSGTSPLPVWRTSYRACL
jgi:hypothetical protein